MEGGRGEEGEGKGEEEEGEEEEERANHKDCRGNFQAGLWRKQQRENRTVIFRF